MEKGAYSDNISVKSQKNPIHYHYIEWYLYDQSDPVEPSQPEIEQSIKESAYLALQEGKQPTYEVHQDGPHPYDDDTGSCAVPKPVYLCRWNLYPKNNVGKVGIERNEKRINKYIQKHLYEVYLQLPDTIEILAPFTAFSPSGNINPKHFKFGLTDYAQAPNIQTHGTGSSHRTQAPIQLAQQEAVSTNQAVSTNEALPGRMPVTQRDTTRDQQPNQAVSTNEALPGRMPVTQRDTTRDQQPNQAVSTNEALPGRMPVTQRDTTRDQQPNAARNASESRTHQLSPTPPRFVVVVISYCTFL